MFLPSVLFPLFMLFLEGIETSNLRKINTHSSYFEEDADRTDSPATSRASAKLLLRMQGTGEQELMNPSAHFEQPVIPRRSRSDKGKRINKTAKRYNDLEEDDPLRDLVDHIDQYKKTLDCPDARHGMSSSNTNIRIGSDNQQHYNNQEYPPQNSGYSNIPSIEENIKCRPRRTRNKQQ